ncbi:MAG: hypothetical protein EBR82_27915 [Caulobacteraceae bacterium]|nr:hypothetical protein [Caulobacteraceae bacterium]
MQSKSEILNSIRAATTAKKPVAVTVEGIESPFYVGGIKAWQRTQWESSAKDNPHVRGDLVALCLCDESGNHFEFSRQEMDELDSGDAKIIDTLFDECLKIIGASKEAKEQAEKK